MRVSFTKEANKPETATMSPAEKAKLDAARITQEDLSHFDTDGTGDLLHRSNDTFPCPIRLTGSVMRPES